MLTLQTVNDQTSSRVAKEAAGEVPQMDTQELPQEILSAIERQDRHDARAERDFGWGDTTRGLALTERYIGKLSDAVREELDSKIANNTKEGPLLRLLKDLPAAVTALAALQTALHVVAVDSYGRQKEVGTLVVFGAALMHECWAAKLTHDQPKLAARISKAVRKRHGRLKERRQAARSIAARAGFKTRQWTRQELVIAGNWIRNIVLKSLPEIFEIQETPSGERYLTLTETALCIADDVVGNLILRNPVYQPLVQAPVPWTSWNHGGADVHGAAPARFIRSRYKDTQVAVKHAIASGQMAPAVEAVNVLQGVPWTINTQVLDVLRACKEQGIAVEGLPPAHNLDMPPKPRAWETMSEQERTLWKIRAGETKKANRSFVSERVLLTEDLKTAEHLAHHDRFYTPMNCDWRGRVYPMCHFNFQREDRVRALFLFADGEPLGNDGLFWLKVHTANCGDFDKISKRPLRDRAAWVDANMEMIRKCVQSPLSLNSLSILTKADKPFLFLATCFELVGALSAPTLSNFVTRLPVSFDGSCSGLQHLCAMTRAAEGSLVNLTPAPEPQDVYETIADRTRELVERDQENPELAKLLLDYGITRKTSKRNVMTYSYSSKKFGMAAQQQEDLMEPLALEVLKGTIEEHPFAPFHIGSNERPSKAARFIAGHVFDAIEQEIHLPAEAMKFLQKLAKAMAHEGKPLRWTSPVGIPWINRYHESKTTRIELWLHDKGVRLRTQVTVAVGSEVEIAKDKAANGVAPNFVHALDAAHLLLTARAASREGITGIATVHDSFGCLASRATRFNQIIREQFVSMYEEHDVLSEVLEQAKCDLTHANWDRLLTVPQRGPLDLKEVLHADFAFA